jgi:hypothetical protein
MRFLVPKPIQKYYFFRVRFYRFQNKPACMCFNQLNTHPEHVIKYRLWSASVATNIYVQYSRELQSNT